MEEFTETMIAAIEADPIGILLMIAVFFLITYFLMNSLERHRRKGAQDFGKKTNRANLSVVRPNKGGPWRKGYRDMSDPANQMEAISLVKFETIKLMNASEKRLYTIIKAVLASEDPEYTLMAQTSLGEIIRPVSKDKQRWARANASVNSKRLDMAIFHASGHLMLAIEYQGSGHYHHKTFMRDAVKREALRRAGVPLVEVPEKFTEDSVRALLSPYLDETEVRR